METELDILNFIEERTEPCNNDCITLYALKKAIKAWFIYHDKGKYNINKVIQCMDSKYNTCKVYWYDCRLKPLPTRPTITPFYG